MSLRLSAQARLYAAIAFVLIVLLAAVAPAQLAARAAEAQGIHPTGSIAFVYDATVDGHDNVPIAVTVFRPAGATAVSPVPVVLHSHGWAGSRAKAPEGIAGMLVEAGFGVVSVDTRGHGDSGGVATFQAPEAEVRDHRRILDWIHDHLDWVATEPLTGIPKDVRAGATGYSYGGGFQTTLATHDARLDAIAPEITWNDVGRSLAPAGVAKTFWINYMVGLAKSSGTRMDPALESWWAHALATGEAPPEALARLTASDPDPSRIRADVLLVQGVSDTLFPINEALASYAELEARGEGDARLLTHLTGHVLPAQPFDPSKPRAAPLLSTGPCGNHHETIVAWLGERLRGEAPVDLAKVSFALDDGTCLRLDRYAPTTRAVTGLPPVPVRAASAIVPLVEGPLVVAGVPRLDADVLGAAPGVAYASLVVLGPEGARVVDDQSMPFRYAPGARLDVELAGVATRLRAGETLALRLDAVNEWFANGERLGAPAVLANARVLLPTLPDSGESFRAPSTDGSLEAAGLGLARGG